MKKKIILKVSIKLMEINGRTSKNPANFPGKQTEKNNNNREEKELYSSLIFLPNLGIVIHKHDH